MRQEEFQGAQDGVLHVVAEPQPVALHVEVLLEDDLVEEDVLGEGQPLALGQVVVPQVAAQPAGQLLHARALDALAQEAGDVDVLQDDRPVDHVGGDVGGHLGQAESHGGGRDVGPPVAGLLTCYSVVT